MQQVRMSAVQPSRHTVGCGGYLFVGPSLFEPCCRRTRGASQQQGSPAGGADGLSLGSREVPLALAAAGSALVFAFYLHVASGPIARCVTVVLWATALALTVRITCRDPGVLPRAWQVTQCPRLSDQVEQLVHRNQATADANICSTCCVVRPSCASHCSTCDACIVGFDHHCFWLGACIGERNHADFLLLLYHGVICGSFAGVQCAAVVLGPTPHTELLRLDVYGGAAHGIIMSILALFSGHFDYIFMRLRFPLDRLFCTVLAHPALGYGILGGLLAVWWSFRVMSQLLRLAGLLWLGHIDRMGLCSGTVMLLVATAICFCCVHFSLQEAWALNDRVPVTTAEAVAALIVILILVVLPMWTAFAWQASVLVSRNVSRKAWLHQIAGRSRNMKLQTLVSDAEWEKRLRATSGPAGGEVTFLRRLQEFISRTPPPSILGQRGGWSAFVRWDADEISAANRMASARNENLTAIATAGRADDLTGGNAAAALQRMRVVQATPVAAADRSMNVYAPNGRLEMSAFKNL